MDEKLPDQRELNQTADLLIASKESILEIWKTQIQKELPAARGKSKTALEDHVPQLLEAMAQTMREGIRSDASSAQNRLSQKHGRQRAGLEDYTLEEVLQEYRIAREITIFELNKKLTLSAKSQCMVNRVIDMAIIESGAEFSKYKNDETFAAQQKAEQAQTRAESANQAKTDFLANMSHEIRTPLGALLGFTELMRDPNLSNDERLKFADVVNRNGRQLSSLINDILDISKIEAGEMHTENIPTSLPRIVTDVFSIFEEIAASKNIKLSLSCPPSIPETVFSDPTRLTQILTNMIGNAIKFTAQGEIRVALARRGTEGSDHYAFVVSDTGIGISDESKSRLFKSFSQADTTTSRRFGGTGLGLFLSQKLAQALGGDLILEKSVVNQGSTFVATFIAPEILHQQKNENFSTTDATASRILRKLKILLAEDSPDNQVLISRYLNHEGADVDLADNGEEAIAMAEKNKYDLVILDIQMPILDGYEAAKRLREIGFTKPIIALTANALDSQKEKAFLSGCDAHLTKPINRPALIKTIFKLTFKSSK